MKYQFDWKKYAEIARQASAESCVLLRNEDNALPIRAGETVSVFGRIQFTYYKSGTGSGGMVNAPYVVNILDGLRACNEIHVNEELVKIYEDWIAENPFDLGGGWAQEPWSQKEMPLTKEIVAKAAEKSDIAVFILGRTAGEDQDNSAAEGSYLLTAEEENALKIVCENFQRVAVVLNVGNIIDMKWVDTCKPQAVLYAWQGGMEGGNAAADVLTGKVNPCGRLADTIAKDISDYPSTKNFGDTAVNLYEEDIYVGYRYFETFAKEAVKYPFGYGLSYTTFQYEVISHTIENDVITMEVSVKNIGKTAGKDVVQIYFEAPQGQLGKPVRTLIRYAKTGLLGAGESETFLFTCKVSELASYDDSGCTGHKSAYVLEPGKYEFYVGSNVRSADGCFRFEVPELIVVEELQEAIAPVRAFERIKPVRGAVGFEAVKEPVPTRTIDLMERIQANVPAKAEYTGDRGYKLSDVYDNKITMNEFLAQLSDDDLICMTRGEGMCSPKVTAGTASAFGGVTDSLLEFGIPVACCADGPSGIRMDCGTRAFSLPNGTGLACTFNVKLVSELFEMLGLELRKNKVDSILGPGMNIHRNPLNGRNFEYFSEDPYLVGTIAAAELTGLHKYGVTGTIKHFACNNQEVARHDADSVVSERALREIYLKGFERAVKDGKAYSIMSTYGPLNGLWTAGNYDLLTTVLRNEWGYKGMVMTDWWAKINDEGEPGTLQNTTAMVRAQNDVFMVASDSATNSGNDNTAEGLKNGKISRAELVRNAANICNVVMKSPVMDRFLGRNEDTFEEINTASAADDNLIEMGMQEVDGETLLNLEGIRTDKGTNLRYILHMNEMGRYRMTFTMRSFAGELAQLPISIFRNGEFVTTITINGTNGEWVTREAEFDVWVSLDNYTKLFFGEGGIEIREIKIAHIG